jgi:hypothetical protein
MRRASSNDVSPRSTGPLWLGVLGPPTIWLTQFEIRYALAGAGRASRHGLPMLVTSIIALAAMTLCGYIAARERQLAAASPLDVEDRIAPRTRFMGTLGLLLSGLFFVGTVIQALADFFFNPGVS